MKKHTLISSIVLSGVATTVFLVALAFSNQPKPTVAAMPMCHDVSAAIAEFAAFAHDEAFKAAHPDPLPTEIAHGGRMVEFPVEGGPNGRGFLMQSHGRTNKYLLLFHEWWGLNDHIKNEVSMWCHTLGINVLALDLYDGKLATTAEEAGKLMQDCDQERAAAIILGASKVLGEDVDYRTMGWCFGGGWALQAALLLGEKTKGCVIFYGMPERDVNKLKTLASDALFIHASQDQWINDEVVLEFEANMRAAERTVTVHRYDANHAFANPSSPRYNDEAAKAARTVVQTYLRGK